MTKTQDVEHARQIAAAFERINELRGAINSQFQLIEVLMEKDGQPQHEIEDVNELRIAIKKTCHSELVQKWMRWTDIADARMKEGR